MSDERKERLAETNFWGELLALRDRQRAERKGGMQVLKRRDLPLESNRQGLMRWYMHPEIKDTVLSTYLCFEQEIPPGGRTGRLKFQGGQVIYVIAGRGYTLLDGVKHPWEAGAVINLPLRRGGMPPLAARRMLQYSQVRVTTFGSKLREPASLTSPL